MSASNTKDCFRELVGRTVKGVMFDQSSKTWLVLDDGTGFVFCTANGSYWRESAEKTANAVDVHRQKLAQMTAELAEVAILAGIVGTPPEGATHE